MSFLTFTNFGGKPSISKRSSTNRKCCFPTTASNSFSENCTIEKIKKTSIFARFFFNRRFPSSGRRSVFPFFSVFHGNTGNCSGSLKKALIHRKNIRNNRFFFYHRNKIRILNDGTIGRRFDHKNLAAISLCRSRKNNISSANGIYSSFHFLLLLLTVSLWRRFVFRMVDFFTSIVQNVVLGSETTVQLIFRFRIKTASFV